MNAKKPDGGVVELLRIISLVALVAGTVGSEILVIRAGGSAQPLLSVLFFVWIILPLVALAWANIASKSWQPFVRISLYSTTLLIALGSLAFYGRIILPRGGSPRAFVFVMGPIASWALMLIVVPTAAALSRKRKV